jgi:hypothetical protein
LGVELQQSALAAAGYGELQYEQKKSLGFYRDLTIHQQRDYPVTKKHR